MSDVLWIQHGLNRHDCAMHDTRPDRKTDQTAVLERVSGCDDQEYTESGIDTKDHLQILRLTSAPHPPGWPYNRKGIHAGHKDQTHHAHNDAQVPRAVSSRHRLSWDRPLHCGPT